MTEDDLSLAREAARRGSSVAARHFRQPMAVAMKEGGLGPVTAADLETEKTILDYLRAEAPYGFVSEESGTAEGSSDKRWIIDPIDGTRNFSRGLPFFGVSVALVDSEGLLCGAVAEPATGALFSAGRNRGAWMNDATLCGDGRSRQDTVVFANHGRSRQERMRYSEVVARTAADFSVRKFASAALEICYVAAGQGDAFICSGIDVWDYAAGLLIAKEAGCQVSDWKGADILGPLPESKYLLVARTDLHATFVSRLSGLQD